MAKKSILDILINVETQHEKAFKDLNGGFAKLKKASEFIKQTSAELTAMGKGLIAVGAAVTAALGVPIKVAADFEKAMSKVQALSKATGNEFAALSRQARELGQATIFSATEAAEGMGFLAMAGFSATETLKAMPGVLQLAAAASIDLGRAADITSNILTGYGLEVEEITRVNDVLVASFTNANVDLEQMGEAMKLVGPIASTAGVRFEETAAAAALLGNAGFQGTLGGTALRGAIIKLLGPSNEARKTMEGLGISVKKANGDFVGIQSVVEQFEKALVNVGGKAEATAILTEIFGQRAGPGMAALIGQGSNALQKFTDGLDNAKGVTEETYKIMTDNLAGAFKEITSAIKEFLIAGGSPFLKILTEMFKYFAELIRWLAIVVDIWRPWVKWLGIIAGAIAFLSFFVGGVTGALGLFLGALASIVLGGLAVKKTLIFIAASFKNVGIAAGGAAKSVGLFGKVLKGAGIIGLIILLSAAIARVVSDYQDFQKEQDKIREQANFWKDKANEFKEYKDVVVLGTKELKKKNKEEIVQYKSDLEGLRNHLTSYRKSLLAKQKGTGFFGAFTEEANAASDELVELEEKLGKLRPALADLATILPKEGVRLFNVSNLTKNIEEANTKIKETTVNVKEQTTAIKEAYQEEVRKANFLTDAHAREVAMMNSRIKLQTDTTAAVVAGYNTNAVKIRESIVLLGEAKTADDVLAEVVTSNQEKIIALVKKNAESRKLITKAIDTAIKEEKKYGDAVAKIKEQIANSERSLTDELRGLRRTQLTDTEAVEDQKLEASEKVYAARQALETGNTALAKTLANEAKGIYADIARSGTESFEEGVAGVEAAGKLGIEALNNEQEKAEELWESQKESLDNLTTAMEGVKTVTENLTAGIAELTKDKETTINLLANGYDEALRKSTELEADKEGIFTLDSSSIDEALLKQKNLTNDTSATHTQFIETVQKNRWGGYVDALRKATGGSIPGWGGGDKVKALLEPGEFVMRKEAVRKYGQGLFAKLNHLNFDASAMYVKKFATGGAVESMAGADVGAGAGSNNITLHYNDTNINNPELALLMEKFTELIVRDSGRG